MELAKVLISGEKISDIMTHGMGPNPTEKALAQCYKTFYVRNFQIFAPS
jgi:hypothetical protein